MGVFGVSANLLLAVVCLQPMENVVLDEVALIEVNHCYDEHGHHVFDQLIFYDWTPQQSRYNVCAWRLLKSPSQLPRRNWQQNGFEVSWHDNGIFREVSAKAMRETWTQYDPELLERASLPREKRRELRKLRLANSDLR